MRDDNKRSPVDTLAAMAFCLAMAAGHRVYVANHGGKLPGQIDTWRVDNTPQPAMPWEAPQPRYRDPGERKTAPGTESLEELFGLKPIVPPGPPKVWDGYRWRERR